MVELRRRVAAACLALCVTIAGGCGRPAAVSEETSTGFDVNVEAYLFDAQLRRDNQPTSVRLHVYQTDSLLGLGGRGYLGKGALRGWLSRDSATISFPASNEYVRESISDLIGTGHCDDGLDSLDLLAFFFAPPDRLSLDSAIRIVVDYSNSSRPRFELSVPGCDWSLLVAYREQKPGLRPERFEFDDGRGTVLKGKLREYRPSAAVSSARFDPALRPDARRIIP